jgi:hypothetical protein
MLLLLLLLLLLLSLLSLLLSLVDDSPALLAVGSNSEAEKAQMRAPPSAEPVAKRRPSSTEGGAHATRSTCHFSA